MKQLIKLLLITLLLGTTLFAEIFHKPDFDPRLSIEQGSLEWWNHADNDSASAFNIGLLYDTKIKDYKLAELWYKQALNVDSKNIDAIINLGVIYDDKKKYNDAIKWYQQGYAINQNKDVANNLGLIYDHKNKFQLAISWYKKAIERESLDAIKNLGRLYYYKLHDDVKAATYFIALIDNKYPKKKVITYLKTKWNLSDETIKQGYEAQLNSTIIPEKLKYKGGI